MVTLNLNQPSTTMKTIDALLKKTSPATPDSENRVDVVAAEESMILSGGDKEYKPVYDELEADDHFRFGSSSVFNFFDNLF